MVAQAPQIRHPSVVCCAPDGRVFVAEDPMDISAPRADLQLGRILCIAPDGKTTVFAEKLHAVFGMQYLDGKLYVLHNPRFSVFRDDNGVGKDRVDLIESTHPNPWALDWNDHVPANFRLAMDGFFYFAVGDKGLFNCVGKDGRRVDLRGGGIVRMRPDGTGLEVYCTGVRNILDVAMNDEDEMFTYDNTDEQQWMGRLTHMVDGGFYGYPYDFIPRRPYTLWMMADYGGGAATGALCYTEDALPKEYHGDLLLADFGKRNILRVKVAREGGTYRAVSRTDLFEDPPAMFRPVGIALSDDGMSLYICDWQHADTKENVAVGRLLKMTWKGPGEGTKRPVWYVAAASGREFEARAEELVAALKHPSRNVRMVAQRRLTEREKEGVAALRKLVADSQADARSRVHAMWILEGSSGLIEDRDPLVRRQAIRRAGTLLMAREAEMIAGRLKDERASVRMAAAIALGRIGDERSVEALLGALSDSDEWVGYAVFTAIGRLGRSHPKAWAGVAAKISDENETVRQRAEFAMRETYDAVLLSVLAEIVWDGRRPEHARAAAVRLLTGMHRKRPAYKGEWWAYHPVNSLPPRKSEVWEGTPAVMMALRKALNDPSIAVKIAAVRAVAMAGDVPSARLLRRMFERSGDNTLKGEVLGALALLGDDDARTLVVDTLEESQEKALLEAAIDAAGKLGGPLPTAAVIRLVRREKDLELRLRGIEVLGELKAVEGADALKEATGHPEAEVRKAGLLALAKVKAQELRQPMFMLLQDADREVRKSAVMMAGQAKIRDAVPALVELAKEGELRDEAIAALAKMPDVRAVDGYLDGLASKNPALREEARKAIEAVKAEAKASIENRVAGLADVVVVELQKIYGQGFGRVVKALAVEEYQAHALANAGDPARGRVLFFDESGVACSKCHAVGRQGGLVGPDLTTIGAQNSRAALVEHVLYPNKAVREGYQEFVVETKDRDVISGILKAETDDELTLHDSAGVLHRIKKSQVTKRRTSAVSLMPEGLAGGLSLGEFADLIAFLESAKAPVNTPPAGFVTLFNGKDLTGWKTPGETAKHWVVKDGVLEHDGVADDLWTEKEFGDFVLKLEWRFPGTPQWADHPVIDRDGNEVKDANGKVVTQRVLEAGDSGVFLRGFRKAQANLFCYPVGSGEVWEYRTDEKMPAEVRKGVTPKVQADRPPGEWNAMTITMRGEKLTVELNGVEVISEARLPGVPAKGAIGFQHEHGVIQFRNVYVKSLNEDER